MKNWPQISTRRLSSEPGAAHQAHPDIRHFGEVIRDFADTAALISLVDLVISVETSVWRILAA